MNTTTAPEDNAGEPLENSDSPIRNRKENRSSEIWWRLGFMAILVVLYGISRVVVSAVVVLQFFWVLLTSKQNTRLSELGQSLATYTYQIIRYLTFNTETKPFPFNEDWPHGAPN